MSNTRQTFRVETFLKRMSSRKFVERVVCFFVGASVDEMLRGNVPKAFNSTEKGSTTFCGLPYFKQPDHASDLITVIQRCRLKS